MLRREVPADEVFALLSASGGVYEDYLTADALRDELVVAGIPPERTSPAESSQLLCTWIAYASVSLARAFLDAEGVSAATGAFLPQVSADQVLTLLREVPTWSGRARRAVREPGYDVAAEVRLPVPLPWVIIEPCPRTHLEAMCAAGMSMSEHIDAALSDVERLSGTPSPALTTLRGMAADAATRLEYANRLAAAALDARAVHEQAEAALRDAVSFCWMLGQFLARPRLSTLAGTQSPRSAPRPGHVPPGPPTPQYPISPWHEHYHGHHNH